MWAIRKASLRIKPQPFPPVTFHASYAKSETSSSSYTNNNTGFNKPPPHTSDRSLTLNRFYGSQISFIRKHNFSSLVKTKNVEHETDSQLISEYEYDDNDIVVNVPQNEWDLSDTEKEVEENNHQGRRPSSPLFNAIINSSSMSVKESLNKWVEEGNDLFRSDISLAMSEFRKRKMYRKAFQMSEWVETHGKVEFGEKYYPSRVDLSAKAWGLPFAENYIEKIPQSFKKEGVYQALLVNCVLNTNVKKAEQVLKKIQKLKLPITSFACEQLLLLYKRTDRRKMTDVLRLMEKENIKPSLFTYTLLIDTKGRSKDLSGMEQLVEKMKGDGLKPDFMFRGVLARHYVNLGLEEKANVVLKEMEGDNLNETRKVCSSLLPVYALLGSEYDVDRVWKICEESDTQLHEFLSGIDAYGKLKKIEKAEAVFEKMLDEWKQVSAKHYVAMLKVYACNKMWTKGKNVVKRMDESGCGIGPDSLYVIVKFYLEAGDIEKAGLMLKTSLAKIKGKPWSITYMMVLDEYGKRGDVCNAEKIFERMRESGYVMRGRQYNFLLGAYVNGKVAAYGFRKRLEADGIVPNKFMDARLARLDVLKDTTWSQLLD